LHTEDPQIRSLDRLHTPITADSGTAQAWCEAVHGLMMTTVHRSNVGA
jgi:hypothetical protein